MSRINTLNSESIRRIGRVVVSHEREKRMLTKRNLKGGGDRTRQVLIQTIAEDSLGVRQIDREGNPTGDTFTVARHPAARPDLASIQKHYNANITSSTPATGYLATSVSDGTDDEFWEIRPKYQPGQIIEIERVVFTGVTDAGGEPVRWQEVRGRFWCWDGEGN